ncbi:MAG: energy-coupling factor transporter transmembrane protein EcfT [Clostridia bacterium]|nr:energy-coupling factor transporter transmembrane protein EcfT [Clostridia bacterium]
MSRSITLGQYYPASSVLHRADGRMKLILTVVFMVMCFLCKSLASFALLLLFTLGLVFASTVPLKIVLKSVRMIIFILIFTFVLNIFFTPGTGEPLLAFWIFRVYKDGIWKAFFMSFRVFCLVIGTGLLISYTTSPVDITHSIESLLMPLSKIGIPVHSFAMMMFIALRFIPTLSDDAEKIMTAQRSRGVDFSSGPLMGRIRSLVSVLIPLFVSSFRRADELAVAMECRCYHGGEGKTSLHVMKVRFSDFVILFVFLAVAAGTVLLNGIKFGYSM